MGRYLEWVLVGWRSNCSRISSSAGLLQSVLGRDRNQKFTWTRMNDLAFMKILFETALLLKG